MSNKLQLEKRILSSLMGAPSKSEILIEAMLSLQEKDFDSLNRELFNFLKTRFDNGDSINLEDLVVDVTNKKIIKLINECSEHTYSFSSLIHYVNTLKYEN